MLYDSSQSFSERANSILSAEMCLVESTREILLEVDHVRDNPASNAWLPALAKLTIACRDSTDASLVDRFVNYCSLADRFVPGSGCELQFEKILYDVVQAQLERFPPCTANRAANRLSYRIPCVRERDDILFGCLDVERKSSGFGAHSARVAKEIDGWIRNVSSQVRSANYVISLIECFTSVMTQSKLYEDPIFKGAIENSTLRTAHLINAWEKLVTVFSEDEMHQIEQLVC